MQLLVWLVAAFACNRSESAREPASVETLAESAVPATESPPRPVFALPSAQRLARFPVESNLLVGLRGDALRKSLLHSWLATLVEAKAGASLAKLRQCGLDLLGATDSVLIAGDHRTGRYLMEVSGLTRAGFRRCGATKNKRPAISVADKGPITTIKVNRSKGGPRMRLRRLLLAWTDDDSFITGPEWTAAQLSARLEPASGLATGHALVSLARRIELDAAVWAALIPHEPAPVPLLGDRLYTSVYGAVGVSDGLRVVAGVYMVSARDAEAIVLGLSELLTTRVPPSLRPLMSKVSVRTSKNAVTFDLQLSESDVTDLTQNHVVRAVLTGQSTGSGAPQ